MVNQSKMGSIIQKERDPVRIKRDRYLEALKHRMHNGMVKVITGMRRSGKSYLLNEIFFDHLLSLGIDEERIIKFAFDSADDLALIGEDLLELEQEGRKVDPKKFLAYIKKRVVDDGDYYLLLDEIQNLGSFESVLNGYLRKKSLDLYVTGSNSKFLSSDVLTEFEGRGDEIHVFPLSFSEFASAYKGSKEEAYEQYSFYGGLPLLMAIPGEEEKAKYLDSQVKKTYLKDIVTRYKIRGDNNIGELLDVLASGIGGLTNPAKLEMTFQSVKKTALSRMTIAKYIDYFTDAFLLSKALRYDVKGKRYIDTPFKLYFEDVGVRNARLGFRQVEPTHIMENIIYNELRYRGFNVDVGVVPCRKGEKGENTLEVDFVATLGSKRYYIQSSYDIPSEEKWLQETRSLSLIRDSFKKIVIVRNPAVTRYNEEGIMIIGLLDFLLDLNSLDR